MSPFCILLELRVTKVVLTTGAIRQSKIQSKCHHQQTNTLFYRPDALPVTQPAVQSTEGTPKNKIDAYVITYQIVVTVATAAVVAVVVVLDRQKYRQTAVKYQR